MSFLKKVVSLQRQSYILAQKCASATEVGSCPGCVVDAHSHVYMIGVYTKTWPGHFRCKGNKNFHNKQ